jgi:hypothetical protein
MPRRLLTRWRQTLQPLVTSGTIKRMSKYDTNPANNPQPPQRLRERG